MPAATTSTLGPHHRVRPSWLLIGFVALYMVVCSFFAIRAGNSEFMMYAGMMVVFIVLILALHRRIGFTPAVLWLLAIWGGLHMGGGTISIPPEFTDTWRSAADPEQRPESAVLYSLRLHPDLPRYDQIVHVFGFFAATLACFQGLRVLLTAPRTVATVAAAALMGIGLGAVNELVEFAAVLSLPETNVGGYMNTGWDLVANTFGALAAALICIVRR